MTDGGHSVDSSYGDSLEEAGFGDVVGASLVRTVAVAACGGFVLGWLPGLLLLEVLEFNLSFFPSLEWLAWWDTAAAQALQLVALAALVAWRWGDELPLARAQGRLMRVEETRDEDARENAVREVMVAVGWSYFVQGGLGCWALLPALTLARIAALLGAGLAWLALDHLDLAPFSLEVRLARLLPAPAAPAAGAKGGAAAGAAAGATVARGRPKAA